MKDQALKMITGNIPFYSNDQLLYVHCADDRIVSVFENGVRKTLIKRFKYDKDKRIIDRHHSGKLKLVA